MEESLIPKLSQNSLSPCLFMYFKCSRGWGWSPNLKKNKYLLLKSPEDRVFHWTSCCTSRDFTSTWVTRFGYADMLTTLYTETERNWGQLAHCYHTFCACKTGWLHPDCLFRTATRLYQLLSHSQESFRKALLGPNKTPAAIHLIIVQRAVSVPAHVPTGVNSLVQTKTPVRYWLSTHPQHKRKSISSCCGRRTLNFWMVVWSLSYPFAVPQRAHRAWFAFK